MPLYTREFRPLMDKIPQTPSALASIAGLEAKNVIRILTKEKARTISGTKERIKACIRWLEGRCPDCLLELDEHYVRPDFGEHYRQLEELNDRELIDADKNPSGERRTRSRQSAEPA